MRYNLTIDDATAATIEAEAKKQSLSAVEFIRNVLCGIFPAVLNLETNKFKIVYLNNLWGKKLTSIDGRRFIVSYTEGNNGMTKTISKTTEVPSILVEFLDDHNNDDWDRGFTRLFQSKGTFTAMPIGNDEYILCWTSRSVAMNTITTDTLDNAEKTWIVSGKLISEFFSEGK